MEPIFAVLGASGQTGRFVAEELLRLHKTVRLISRSSAPLKSLIERGAEFIPADLKNKGSLDTALQGVHGVYIMNPPNYRCEDMLKDAKENIASIKSAVLGSGVKKVVLLSSVGSQLSSGLGNIMTTHYFENEFRSLPLDVGVLRAAWFMENWKTALAMAIIDGILPSMIAPITKKTEMVSAEDIGRVAAGILVSTKQNEWVELAGPEAYSPNDVALASSKILNREVAAKPLSNSDIANLFKGLPEKVIADWIEMVNGFNSDHIVFEGKDFKFVRGQVSMRNAIEKMVAANSV